MKVFEVNLKDHFLFIKDSGLNPVLRCYIPDEISQMKVGALHRPSILICPGGGYFMCADREAEPVALPLLANDFNVFVLYYSCSPAHYPTQLLQVAAAYELINRNADEWLCDASKIGIMGFSAGGHLAAHYSNAYNSSAVRDVFPDSKKPFCSVLCYPVITAHTPIAHTGSFVGLLGENPQNLEKFSCDKMVTADTPPAFIWHTVEDKTVPVQNSLLYAEALSNNGVSYEMHIYPYGVHGLSTLGENVNVGLDEKTLLAKGWLDELIKWLKILTK